MRKTDRQTQTDRHRISNHRGDRSQTSNTHMTLSNSIRDRERARERANNKPRTKTIRGTVSNIFTIWGKSKRESERAREKRKKKITHFPKRVEVEVCGRDLKVARGPFEPSLNIIPSPSK